MAYEPEVVFDTSFNQRGKPKESTLLTDIGKYDIPDEIREQAQDVARRLDLPVRRGKKRKQLIFYCIYSAYAELSVICDPHEIAKKVGIQKSQIGKALSLFSDGHTGYCPPSQIASPVDFVPQYGQAIGLTEDAIEELVEFSEQIIEKGADLQDCYPQKVAAALLSFYLSYKGIQIREGAISDLCGFSDPTIKSVAKKITMIYNA